MDHPKLKLVKTQTPDSYKAWCDRIDESVEAQALKCTGEAAPTAPPSPEPKREQRDIRETAPRARKELRAALRKMHDMSVLQVWGAWQAIGPNNQGCDSPFEEFLDTLLMEYTHSICQGYQGVTPDAVEPMFKDFRRDFYDMVSRVREFGTRYSEAIQAPDKEKVPRTE